MCKVSVVIPIYNVEKTIERCLVSVLNQTFTDYEIILVNDGTKDNSISVIEKYLSDKRITLINQQNCGLPQTRCNGFLQSKGEYVYFIDSDDYIRNDTLERLVTEAEKNDADVVCCNIRIDRINKEAFLKSKRNGLYTPEEALNAISCMNGIFQYVWNKLYKREIIESTDFPQGHFIGEDYATVVSILQKAKRIYQIPDMLYNYVENPFSMTKAGFGETYIQAYNQNARIKKILDEKYPSIKRNVAAYHILQEMGIINAMFRNDVYDQDIKTAITRNIKKNWTTYVFNRHTPFFYKICVLTAAMNLNIYNKIYKKIYFKKGK